MRKSFKFLSFIMCLSVVFVSLGVGVYAVEPVLGDVDGNGIIDTADVRSLLKMAAGLTYSDLDTADMDADGVVSLRDAIEVLKVVSNIGGEAPDTGESGDGSVVIPDKNGDNFLSDSAENEFIKIISSTYNIDPQALVAIYSEPDTGTNYVLEFKKSLIGNKYEKKADNLKKVYHIGLAPERKISYTNGKFIAGDHYNCEPAEGVIVFNLVKSEVMAQFPDYFEN